MAGQLGKFTMQHFDAWAPNITKKTHISSIFGSKTQKVNGLMVELMAAKYGKTLDTMLSGLPTKEFESGDDYVWDVTGSTDRVIPLVECRDENGVVVDANYTDNVGAGTQPFPGDGDARRNTTGTNGFAIGRFHRRKESGGLLRENAGLLP